MNCTRCSGTGFLNLEQVPDSVIESFEKTGEHGVILDWIAEMKLHITVGPAEVME